MFLGYTLSYMPRLRGRETRLEAGEIWQAITRAFHVPKAPLRDSVIVTVTKGQDVGFPEPVETF